MQSNGPALPFVNHLHLQPEQVTELSLKHLQVCVDRLAGVAGARSANVHAWTGPGFLSPNPGLCLAHRKALGDDLAGQSQRIVGSQGRARMAHADIAFQ